MELTGRLIMKTETQSFGSNGFEKREIAIQTEEQYPQKILIEFTQQKCDLVDGLKKGELIKVSVNIRGRDWVNPQGETKYFNSFQGWKVDRLKGAVGYKPEPNTPTIENKQELPEEDDLPF